MKLRKALQVKNKMAGEIGKNFQIIQKHNVLRSKTPTLGAVTYDTKKLLLDTVSMVRGLAAHKTKIALANAKIQSNIFLMGELKGLIKQLHNINVDGGEQQIGYGEQAVIVYDIAQINELEVAAMVKSLETEIEKLQDEVDYHNAASDIDG